MSRQRLPDPLWRRARDRPDALALIADGMTWNYAQLDATVSGVAARLRVLGVRPGDRVGVLMRNGAGFVQLVHGLARAGAIVVPLNRRLAPPELAWQLADAGVRLLVHDDRTATLAREAVGGTVRGPELLTEAAIAKERPPGQTRFGHNQHDLDEIHSIVYTSGTTGRPRGAILTWGNLWWSAMGSALNLGLRDDDRWLAVLPLFHVGGLAILIRSAIYGTAAIVQDDFEPAAANRAIDEDRATLVSVVAVMLERMLAERGNRPYPAWLRAVLVGGGPVPRPLLEACAARGVPVAQTYGLTETASQVATLAPRDALRRPGSSGQPLLPVQLAIHREDGSEAAPGEPGQIVVRGPVVSPGYWQGSVPPDGTDGWFRTGDVGTIDVDGYLYVLDRRDDLIISGGENVYPAEIESVLVGHPAVAEAGVVGIADAVWGQVPVAVVRLTGDSEGTAEALLAHCAARLARYKLPRRVVVTAEPLPRTASGKLRRAELRAFFVTDVSAADAAPG